MNKNPWKPAEKQFRASEESKAGYSFLKKESDNIPANEKKNGLFSELLGDTGNWQKISIEAPTPEMAQEAAGVLADYFNKKEKSLIDNG